MANSKITSLTFQVEGLVVSLDGALLKVGEVEQRIGESSEKIEGGLQATRNMVNEANEQIRGAVAGLEERTGVVSKSVQDNIGQARDSVQQGKDEINSALDEMMDQSATALDDMLDILENATGIFDKELKAQLELIKLGLLKVSDLDRKYKDALIGGERLITQLQGLDDSQFEQNLQRLTRLMEKGKVSIGEALDFLISKGGDLGKSFADWIQKAQDGTITMTRFREEIRRLLSQLEDFGADTAGFEDLFDELGDLLEQDSATS